VTARITARDRRSRSLPVSDTMGYRTTAVGYCWSIHSHHCSAEGLISKTKTRCSRTASESDRTVKHRPGTRRYIRKRRTNASLSSDGGLGIYKTAQDPTRCSNCSRHAVDSKNIAPVTIIPQPRYAPLPRFGFAQQGSKQTASTLKGHYHALPADSSSHTDLS
jgi:hypothetical protein